MSKECVRVRKCSEGSKVLSRCTERVWKIFKVSGEESEFKVNRERETSTVLCLSSTRSANYFCHKSRATRVRQEPSTVSEARRNREITCHSWNGTWCSRPGPIRPGCKPGELRVTIHADMIPDQEPEPVAEVQVWNVVISATLSNNRPSSVVATSVSYTPGWVSPV